MAKGDRLIGYVRLANRDEMYTSEQNSVIESYASKEGLDIVHVEHEVSNGNQIMRLGLWRALRMMACSECEPKQMPMADMYDYWFKEAIKPCTCKNPKPCAGLIVDDIRTISTTQSQGAKFTLDMCAIKKHVIVASLKVCFSCCNPQALEFVKRQMLNG